MNGLFLHGWRWRGELWLYIYGVDWRFMGVGIGRYLGVVLIDSNIQVCVYQRLTESYYYGTFPMGFDKALPCLVFETSDAALHG